MSTRVCTEGFSKATKSCLCPSEGHRASPFSPSCLVPTAATSGCQSERPTLGPECLPCSMETEGCSLLSWSHPSLDSWASMLGLRLHSPSTASRPALVCGPSTALTGVVLMLRGEPLSLTRSAVGSSLEPNLGALFFSECDVVIQDCSALSVTHVVSLCPQVDLSTSCPAGWLLRAPEKWLCSSLRPYRPLTMDGTMRSDREQRRET